jgi:DNA polymerase III epsilon subunit-like protein
MRFAALDLETANSRFTSICQIGISVFEDNREVEAVPPPPLKRREGKYEQPS